MNSPRDSILLAYAKLNLTSANEAATRLKLIDRVIKEILGWTDDDIHPEEHVSEDGKTTFSDYILRTANNALVIEAKKTGVAFELIKNETRKYKLTKTFVSGELGDAIIQARDYARKLSIDFAVVTNGNVWIVFPAQRHDQVPFNESYAIVFPSLNSILNEDYQEFVELLSRNAVIDGSIDRTLIGRSENQIGQRKLAHAFTPTVRASTSNPLYPFD